MTVRMVVSLLKYHACTVYTFTGKVVGNASHICQHIVEARINRVDDYAIEACQWRPSLVCYNKDIVKTCTH